MSPLTRLFACALSLSATLSARAAEPPATPRASAKIELSGYWVAVITEDWRWRMMTAPKGDFASIPFNDAGRKEGLAWDLARDNATGAQCKAYGAPGLLRIPGRLHISWADDSTLQLETDAGRQTRLLHFGAPEAEGQPSLQGYSHATWEKQEQGVGFVAPGGRPKSDGAGGTLHVSTTRLLPGYLRKNGAPYSERATLTEYFDRLALPNGQQWLVVTSIVDDPKYLREPWVTSTDFKLEPDATKWHPGDCYTPPPTLDHVEKSN
jgi:hypothetical protein